MPWGWWLDGSIPPRLCSVTLGFRDVQHFNFGTCIFQGHLNTLLWFWALTDQGCYKKECQQNAQGASLWSRAAMSRCVCGWQKTRSGILLEPLHDVFTSCSGIGAIMPIKHLRKTHVQDAWWHALIISRPSGQKQHWWSRSHMWFATRSWKGPSMTSGSQRPWT